MFIIYIPDPLLSASLVSGCFLTLDEVWVVMAMYCAGSIDSGSTLILLSNSDIKEVSAVRSRLKFEAFSSEMDNDINVNVYT